MSLIKGAHYRFEFVYNALDWLKLGRAYNFRFRVAARYIKPGESVLDVCAGPGRLKDFIPKDCVYTAIEAGPEFLAGLQKKGARPVPCDLHNGWPGSVPAADIIVMIISLSQFRTTSADSLLESFKKAAKRVVIVEEVLPHPRSEGSLLQRAVNYLCATDYYVPVGSWYTRAEFARLMRDHGYQCEEVSGRYMVGSYGYHLQTGFVNSAPIYKPGL